MATPPSALLAALQSDFLGACSLRLRDDPRLFGLGGGGEVECTQPLAPLDPALAPSKKPELTTRNRMQSVFDDDGSAAAAAAVAVAGAGGGGGGGGSAKPMALGGVGVAPTGSLTVRVTALPAHCSGAVQAERKEGRKWKAYWCAHVEKSQRFPFCPQPRGAPRSPRSLHPLHAHFSSHTP